MPKILVKAFIPVKAFITNFEFKCMSKMAVKGKGKGIILI